MELLKHKSFLVMMALTGVLALPACSDDDDDITYIPEQYVSALQKIYPTAKQVTWEQEGAYKVADFIYNGYETDVWFDTDAEWVMTETDYDRNINALPAVVVNAFNQSEYSAYAIDDVDGYEREDATFYVIEVEVPRMDDQCIYINDAGVITQVVPDYSSTVTPSSPIM